MSKQQGHGITDDRSAEVIREEILNAEQAARIAAARAKAEAEGRAPADPTRRKQPPYERWTKERLYARAKEVGIGGRSSMNKQALIDALRHH